MGARRKPIECGKDWFEVFGPRGEPRAGERGHTPSPIASAPFNVHKAILRSIEAYGDPELGPEPPRRPALFAQLEHG